MFILMFLPHPTRDSHRPHVNIPGKSCSYTISKNLLNHFLMTSQRPSSLLAATVSGLSTGINYATSAEDFLEKCCNLGGSWAGQKLRCEKFTGPVPGVSPDEEAACLEAVDICCRKSFQELSCEEGKADAKAGLACTRQETGARRTPVGLGDYRRDCCEGCKLGILTGASGKGCASKKFSLGIPWDPAFAECCIESMTSVTQDSSTTTSTQSTSTSTSSSAASSSESEEFDDDIDSYTDSDTLNTFKSDDLCQLMKGLLCSEICVPTPGSYYCKCHEGSILEADGRSCKSNTTITTFILPNTTTPSVPTDATTSSIITSMLSTITEYVTSLAPLTTSESLETTKTSNTSTPSELSSSTSSQNPTTFTAKNSTKAISPASMLKLLTTGAKSRTTRSVPTEDNELNLPCPAGYRFVPSTESCDDIDECADGSHNCGNQKCYNLPGTYQCAKLPVPVIRRKTTNSPKITTVTKPGENCATGSRYDRTRNTCVDINECEELEDACSSNEKCINNPGSFSCICRTGFRREELTLACVDINECQMENHCLPSQRCDNTIGSYACVRFLSCGTGYTLNAATEICEDDNECLLNTHDCGPGYHCRNTLGSFRCDRDRGKVTTTARTTTRRTARPTFKSTLASYTTARTTTTPKPITTLRPTTTSTARSTITTTPKTTTTSMKPQTTTTTTSKPKIITTTTARTTSTERSTTIRKTTPITTTEPIPTVGPLRTTTQTPKIVFRPRTNCPRGFESGPVGQCIDIDECQRNVKICGVLQCINTIGSFRCQPKILCPIGFTPDPITEKCKDINECALGTHKCGPEQTCENRPGGYVCYCPPGYEPGGKHVCIDIDECSRVPADRICGGNSKCINTQGSYRCLCDPGFENDPVTGGCRNVNECKTNSNLCQHNCYDTWGGYVCGCRYGYRLKSDNHTCVDVDECKEFQSNKPCLGICENTPGSYVCTCPSGYKLAEDRHTCQDIDECAQNVCQSPEEICHNIRGGYRCNKINCPDGYIIDSQRRNRCLRKQLYCPVDDPACFRLPSHYSYNYIAIISMYPIPVSTGQLDLFTMRGAYNLADFTVLFSVAFIQARAPPHVVPATEACFALRRTSRTEAVLVMIQSLQGPQDIELELSMEMYTSSEKFVGSAVAKIFIVVTQYEF